MTVQANSFAFPMLNDINYEPYTYNQLMLLNDYCFNISDFLLKDVNNNLYFDGFIWNYQPTSHESSLNKTTRDISDLENVYIDNDSNKFLIERIFKQ